MLSYTVKAGDTLFLIAQKILGDGNRYKEFMSWNPSLTDPNRISVGQVLQYPVMAVPPTVMQSQPAPAAPRTSGVTVAPAAPAPSSSASSGFKMPAILQDKKVLAAIGVALVAALYPMMAGKSSTRAAANPIRRRKKAKGRRGGKRRAVRRLSYDPQRIVGWIKKAIKSVHGEAPESVKDNGDRIVIDHDRYPGYRYVVEKEASPYIEHYKSYAQVLSDVKKGRARRE